MLVSLRVPCSQVSHTYALGLEMRPAKAMHMLVEIWIV